MGYSMDPISANCYPGTTVLINKLDIRDEDTLSDAEAMATYINAAKLEDAPMLEALTLTTTRRFTIEIIYRLKIFL